MLKTRQYILAKQFEGEPKKSDVKLVEVDLSPPKDGEYIVEALFISVDPYQRVVPIKVGSVINAEQVARVIESKNNEYPVGSIVYGHFGWRTRTLVTDYLKLSNSTYCIKPYILPDFGSLPLSLGIGVLGSVGFVPYSLHTRNTAYFGTECLLKPKPGDTVLITGAAGATGAQVGQIAKIKGAKVIGLAGSDAKCDYLVQELGFDHAFNYKTVNLDEALKKVVPEGLDLFFDNVGDKTIDTVLNHLKKHGKLVICGSVSTYNDKKTQKVEPFLMKLLWKAATIEAFHVYDYQEKWQEGILQNLQWVKEGKLKYREHITPGFDKMFEAFLGVLRGENIGKSLVRI